MLESRRTKQPEQVVSGFGVLVRLLSDGSFGFVVKAHSEIKVEDVLFLFLKE